jgi:hypothetical protein
MKKLFLILFINFIWQITSAQISVERQVIGSTGNLTNSGSVKASSNIGEAIISTFSNTSLVLTQGFEQPDTMLITSTVMEDGFKMEITAYPNPARNQVILAFQLDQPLDIGIDIYNETGQQMLNQLKTTVQNKDKKELDFTGFYPGNYFIVIKSNDGKISRGIKVQKIN